MRNFILFFLVVTCLTGCYRFKGFSISEDLRTFYVMDFRNTTANAPPTVQQTFTELLKEKISRESRLKPDNQNPDITFSGTITRFAVTAVAPERDATTAFNRLDIAVSITYENARNADDRWTQTFSHFLDFTSTANLLDVQDELIDQIFDQIIEDVFNKAFTDW
ncbi:MAG TPA: LPS assembly lipoprotein LptE [Saprospiraceae bacterium]|nr:LPS assembly lipoprotein LptE [Saprospiraceae bacterium]